MLARTPVTLAIVAGLHNPKPEPPHRLSRQRKEVIRNHVVAVIRAGMDAGQPSKFWCEASARHGIRSSLCLRGWSWAAADAVAAEIVTAALNIVGAVRPPWHEGQPEWTQNGAGALILRTRCVHCHRKLPEGHTKFCSFLCAKAYHMRLGRLLQARETQAYDIITRRL